MEAILFPKFSNKSGSPFLVFSPVGQYVIETCKPTELKAPKTRNVQFL